MAETLRIEIPIETVDNTDPGVSNATKKFEKMERAANSANSSAKKASDLPGSRDHKPVEESDLPSRSGPGSQYRSERHDRDIQGLRGRNVTGPGYKRSHQHRACQTDE